MAIFAAPDFAGTGAPAVFPAKTEALALRSMEMSDLKNLMLPPLPGTAREGERLALQAEKQALPCRTFTGVEASEWQLFQLPPPRVLHLATHGFCLPATGGLGNPMRTGGFALAGAQRTLESWTAGVVPPSERDGIVTAEEVGVLDLRAPGS